MCLTNVRSCWLWTNLREKSKSHLVPLTKATENSSSLWFLKFKENMAPSSLLHKVQMAHGQLTVPTKLDFDGLSVSASGT